MSDKKQKRNNNIEPVKIWFWSLLGIFIFCILSYGYCVQGTIVNVVTRQNMEAELQVLNSKVLDLESKYIKAKSSITEELAYKQGFVVATNQSFIVGRTDNSSLSLVTPSL